MRKFHGSARQGLGSLASLSLEPIPSLPCQLPRETIARHRMYVTIYSYVMFIRMMCSPHGSRKCSARLGGGSWLAWHRCGGLSTAGLKVVAGWLIEHQKQVGKQQAEQKDLPLPRAAKFEGASCKPNFRRRMASNAGHHLCV